MSNFERSDSQSYVNDQLTPPLNHLAGEFWVKFWGVRGLIPTPNSHTCRYGSNTACVEIYVAGKRLIFDGGTGLRILGKTWQQQEEALEAHLFFTNSQSNRIQGFPFFAPAFVTDNCFHIYGTAASNGASIKQCLCDQMLQPHFPYPLQVMESELLFYNLTPGNVIELSEVKVTTALINKYQRSIGYKVSWGTHSIAYTTDLHKSLDIQEQNQILPIIQDVDLLVANATYTPPTDQNHEYAELLWKTPVELAQTAKVKKLVISHHHPDDDDDFLDKIHDEVKSIFLNVVLASEGMMLYVGDR
ncbi:MBL fold metallo-hydrolase [Sphaerospermopsis sp. LEGE 08334]|jgi:phosphoribosyl 1,2-cyclic phosphodiesterase|uniref:MBL fold metallo-hydrolase n=1 Tax=Sphaerospermopsis sp. LEGE 08334 TaxID=1828651 RepID=UPI001880C287|nr:MBL fold metallo-hydrolase [Sphaerospermopsis sp. LEGE 08334]MBE9054824.1 MBL fold metallo-hydrolase [Sphaerospermopsis sp. LEGE 08334]